MCFLDKEQCELLARQKRIKDRKLLAAEISQKYPVCTSGGFNLIMIETTLGYVTGHPVMLYLHLAKNGRDVEIEDGGIVATLMDYHLMPERKRRRMELTVRLHGMTIDGRDVLRTTCAREQVLSRIEKTIVSMRVFLREFGEGRPQAKGAII